MSIKSYLYTLSLCLVSLTAYSQVPASKSSSTLDLKAYSERTQPNLEKSQIENPFFKSSKAIQDIRPIKINSESLEQNKLNFQQQLKLRSVKQGGESGGGGTIIGYFGAPDESYKTTGVVDSEGRLRSEFRSHIHQAFTTDSREDVSALNLRDSNNGVYEPLDDDTPESYLNRIIEKGITPRSPQFAKILRQALYEVRRELWIPVYEGLPLMQDLGVTPLITSSRAEEANRLGPVLLQVVRRKEMTDPKTGISKVTSIEYDPDLYEKLLTFNRDGKLFKGVYHQAVLLLHEAIYAIATSHGHINSAKVRGLTNLLFELDMYRVVQSNFDFLYMLYAYGILDERFFDLDSGNSMGSAAYTKLISFGEILKRMAEHRRMDLVNKGFNCDQVEQTWPDLNCTIESFLGSLSFSSDFTKMKPEWYTWFSQQEYESYGNDFSFFWALQLGLGYPDKMTQLLSRVPVWPAVFEDFLVLNNNEKNLQSMKSLCSNMVQNAQLNRQAQGFFRQNADDTLKLQELILKKSILYCKSQSAL